MKQTRGLNIFAGAVLLMAMMASPPVVEAQTMSGVSSLPEKRPNILLIVADDLGYSDLGSFGGEIPTPNLDGLALNGVRLTSFYTAPTCSPTRASLMTGLDGHLVGLGSMDHFQAPNQKGKLGYEGYLNDVAVALPTVLKDAGYHTYMAGKWHLGNNATANPAAKGFEKSFAMLSGAGGHFDTLPPIGPGEAKYLEDGVPARIPEEFYSSRFYVDTLTDYIDQNAADGQPFFAYLAFTAPHWPLQAPKEVITRFENAYEDGYDHILEQRMQRMAELGTLPEGAVIPPLPKGVSHWDELSSEQQSREARKMAVYAAMVNELDNQVGRLIAYLKSIDAFDNTLIMFLSDNGAAGHNLEHWTRLQNWVEACCDNSVENMGAANSFIWYGPGWARVSNSPFRYFKSLVSEGGVRSPAFVYQSGMAQKGAISTALLTVQDIMPTLLDIAGIEAPGRLYNGVANKPMTGLSFKKTLTEQASSIHSPGAGFGWELFGRYAFRLGDWKIVWQREPYGTGRWQLYNLRDDPSEAHDLADLRPDKLTELVPLWEIYRQENNIIIPDVLKGYGKL